MPLYEYQCQKCSERTEVVQKFSDLPLSVCSSCGGALKKLISSPAIQFKGSGFYINDYARSSSNGNGSKSSSEGSKSTTPSSSESTTSSTTSDSGSSSSDK